MGLLRGVQCKWQKEKVLTSKCLHKHIHGWSTRDEGRGRGCKISPCLVNRTLEHQRQWSRQEAFKKWERGTGAKPASIVLWEGKVKLLSQFQESMNLRFINACIDMTLNSINEGGGTEFSDLPPQRSLPSTLKKNYVSVNKMVLSFPLF